MDARTPQPSDPDEDKEARIFQPLEKLGVRIQRSVLPIVARIGPELVPLGTGFLINPDGLMMTAKHVVTHFAQMRPRVFDEKGRFVDDGHLFALLISDERVDEADHSQLIGGVFPITEIWFQGTGSDIALCWVRLPMFEGGRRVPVSCLGLTVDTPSVGDELLAFGYHAMNGTYEQVDDMNFNVNVEIQASHSYGKVLDVYPVKRDSVMLNFPCFRTSARYDPGMSGGPIFAKSGKVCGVVSVGSSLELDGYGSTLYPVLGNHLRLALKAGEPAQDMLLFDLVRRGSVHCEGAPERVEIVPHSPTAEPRIVRLKPPRPSSASARG